MKYSCAPDDRGLLAGRHGVVLDARAVERADVAEEVEQGILAAEQGRIAGRGGRGDPLVLAGEGLEPSRVEVVAEQVVDEPLEDPVGALAGGRVSGVREAGTIASMCARRAVGGLDAQQRGTPLDLGVGHDGDRGDDPVEGRG